VLTAGLALVSCDQHGDVGSVAIFFRISLSSFIVETEHVQIERNADPRQDVLEDAVDVVAPHIEQVKILAGGGRVDLFLCIGLQSCRSNRCRLTEAGRWRLGDGRLGGGVAATSNAVVLPRPVRCTAAAGASPAATAADAAAPSLPGDLLFCCCFPGLDLSPWRGASLEVPTLRSYRQLVNL